MHWTLEELESRYPALASCGEAVVAAGDMLLSAYRAGGRVPVCANHALCAAKEEELF